jgi:hypothetical protein
MELRETLVKFLVWIKMARRIVQLQVFVLTVEELRF